MARVCHQREHVVKQIRESWAKGKVLTNTYDNLSKTYLSINAQPSVHRRCHWPIHGTRQFLLGLANIVGVGSADEAGFPETVEFYNLWDVVHLDEKWFIADKDRRKVYLVPREAPPERAWMSKRFVPKVMFLAAVARPRYDEVRGEVFSGKIGMWPCSLQYKKMSRCVDDVIRHTMEAFEVLKYDKLESVFLTFQAVMCLILEHSGGNDYALPHMKKVALRRAGLLMSNVSCPVSLLL
ncbi:hypothetical protein H310_11758 [Aphanomyces invadans]|uniref:Uncharacterized protein n=1 Tax=Aphanomyces invadans TaxID=157072 RepID=A0A024TK87_9STRA|nr:hypothetical protein H310_11758 [Aphanomyces invadans]ETV94433.1 hypothetical protein H310_11758 [Aphanomyces invadans]|eukprot:XP_008876748.1 hypothetical protein H310_11758 [Aphanomyces invadans]